MDGYSNHDTLSFLPRSISSKLSSADASQLRPPRPFRCGSENPPEEIKAKALDFSVSSDAERLAAHAPIVINTYFHVVTSTQKQGQYSQTQLNNQVYRQALDHAVHCMTDDAFSFPT